MFLAQCARCESAKWSDKMKKKAFVQGCLGVALVLAAWIIASRTGIFGRVDQKAADLLFPMPNKVFAQLVEMIRSGYLLTNLLVSLRRVLTGFLIAVCIGLPAGIWIGLSEDFRNIVYPILQFVSPIPGVAWVPLSILWFGLGNRAAIFIIVMGSLSPIITNTYEGVKNIDHHLLWVMDIMEASSLQKIRYCVIPSILPYVIAGFRLGLGFAWRVVIAAEMVGVPRGMGYVLSMGRSTGNTAVTIIVIITLGFIMILLEKVLFNTIEKRMQRWKTVR